MQALCLKVRQHAFCLAELTAVRLRRHRVNGPVEVLKGVYAGGASQRLRTGADPLVLFAARLIPEKRLPLALEAIALARREIPGLTGAVYGRGPDWNAGAALIAERGLGEAVTMADFVDREILEATMRRRPFACCTPPSARATGWWWSRPPPSGLPSILVAGEDNAATELVEDGVNGFVVREPTAEQLSEAIVRVHNAGHALRLSTATWFAANAARLSIDSSLRKVVASYSGSARAQGPGKAR